MAVKIHSENPKVRYSAESVEISFIIVNYNTAEDTRKCLESIQESISGIKYEILVVDNNSAERDIEELPQIFPDVNFFFRDVNDGFGAGNNYALKHAKGSLYMLLNPDIVLTKNCVSVLIEYIKKDDELGVVSPVLYNSDGKIDYYYSFFPSLYSILMIQLGLYNTSKRIKKNMIEFMDSSISKGKPFYVEQAIGACILIKKTVIDIIGGFDEAFFIYQEETDWEYRMFKMGWKVMIIPKAQAFHEHHSSTNKLGDMFVKYQWLRSLIIYYVKNFNLYKRTFLRGVMFFVLLSRGIKYFFSYLLVPETLIKSECSMLKLLKLNFTPRKYLLSDRYVFGGFCI